MIVKIYDVLYCKLEVIIGEKVFKFLDCNLSSILVILWILSLLVYV